MAPDRIARILRDARQRALTDVATRAAEYDAVAASSMAERRDDEHDPDGSTPAMEHSLAFALLSAAEHRVAELDRAIERLAAGTYGRCEGCGKSIAPERLEALPAARTCINCAVTARSGPGRAGSAPA